MNSLQQSDDRMREAQYGRFAINILRVLRDAVDRRVSEGETRASLARKIGCNRSQLSRLLNGNVGNITIRSISDILWATRFEPTDFEALAHEDISSNYVERPIVENYHRITLDRNMNLSSMKDQTSGSASSHIRFLSADHG